MDQKAMMEARVWARVTGQKLENNGETEDISGFLRQEYADLQFYRCLYKKLPCNMVCRLIKLAEDTIKYLKTQYFVETGRCFCEKYSENVCISCVCDALRMQYQSVQKRRNNYEKGCDKWEKAAYNKKCEERILLELLQKVL